LLLALLREVARRALWRRNRNASWVKGSGGDTVTVSDCCSCQKGWFETYWIV